MEKVVNPGPQAREKVSSHGLVDPDRGKVTILVYWAGRPRCKKSFPTMNYSVLEGKRILGKLLFFSGIAGRGSRYDLTGRDAYFPTFIIAQS